MARHFFLSAVAAGLYVVLCGVLLSGCGGFSRLEAADAAGRTVSYEPGVPNFDMEAIANRREGEAGVDVYLGLPHTSLVFVRSGADYAAAYEHTVRLRDRRSREVVREVSGIDTVRAGDYAATQTFTPLHKHVRLTAEAGQYIVEVSLVDLESDTRAVRRQAVTVPAGAEPYLSGVRLEAQRRNGVFEPIVSLHASADMDSLRATAELYEVGTAAEVSMHLLRFPSDTTAAAPPYWLSPSRGSLAYRGVLFNRADTLQATHRRIETAAGEAMVEFSLPHLRQGVYRLVVQVRTPKENGGSEAGTLSRTRILSVKKPGFPEVTRLDELVAALEYIAFQEEVAHIRAAQSVGEVKRRFDAFWGARTANRQVAANLLKLYYGRVEEANLYFSNYKEGWKTDRGMLYIVLGAPVYVEERGDAEVWHYSYGGRDPVNTYVFERVRAFSIDDTFDHYILQRRPYYQYPWTEAIDRWRDGTIL